MKKLLIHLLPILPIFLISLAVLGAYSNIFGNEFVWDDYAFVTDWEEIRDLPKNWGNFWAGNVPEGHEGVYRPVRSILYSLSYSVFGTNPLGYHIQSLAVQMLASILVYLIVREIVKNKSAALVSGLWFGLHPTHTEAITWISASFDSLGVVIMLAGLWCYLKYWQKNESKWYWVCVAAATVAYFSYELALVFPALMIAIDWSAGRLDRKNMGEGLKRYLPFVIADLVYWIIRFEFLNIPEGHPRVFDGFESNLYLSAVMLVRYLWLMLVPILSVNHLIVPGVSGFYYHDFNFEKLPSSIGLLNIDVLVSLLVIAAMIWAVVAKGRKWPVVSLSIIWFVVSLLPIMLVPSFGIIFAERYAYMASVGVAILVGWVFSVISKKLTPVSVTPLLGLVLIVILVMYSATTWQRNIVWKDSVSLWSESLEQRPESAIIHTNLGFAYQRNGDNQRAAELFEKAVAINPNNIVNQESLATIREIGGEFERALTPLVFLTKLNPSDFRYHIRIADAYFNLQKFDEAAKYYASALKIEPEIPYAKAQLMKIAE